eukprot:6492772-Amphidinium_carterae.4
MEVHQQHHQRLQPAPATAAPWPLPEVSCSSSSLALHVSRLCSMPGSHWFRECNFMGPCVVLTMSACDVSGAPDKSAQQEASICLQTPRSITTGLPVPVCISLLLYVWATCEQVPAAAAAAEPPVVQVHACAVV